MEQYGAVIVSWDFSHSKDVGVLLIGKQTRLGKIEIINAIQGAEAEELLKKLIIPKTQKTSFAEGGYRQ